VSGLTPVMSSELSATVTLSSYSWGTRIDMNCTYGVDNSDHEKDSQADDTLGKVDARLAVHRPARPRPVSRRARA